MQSSPSRAKPVVVMLGPYARDSEDGPAGFRDTFRRRLEADGYTVEPISPQAYFGPLARTHGMSRWLGYIDKYAIFPLGLLVQSSHIREKYLGRKIVVHISGQSNALYATLLRRWFPVVVTCHDLLAVRVARGEGGHAPESFLEQLLQKEVLHGLKRAHAVVCVSPEVRSDLLRLAGPEIAPHAEVIPSALKDGDAAAQTMLRAYEDLYWRI